MRQVKYTNNKLIPSKPKYIFKFKDGIIIIFVINWNLKKNESNWTHNMLANNNVINELFKPTFLINTIFLDDMVTISNDANKGIKPKINKI